jgi:hypothetical protein
VENLAIPTPRGCPPCWSTIQGCRTGRNVYCSGLRKAADKRAGVTIADHRQLTVPPQPRALQNVSNSISSL